MKLKEYMRSEALDDYKKLFSLGDFTITIVMNGGEDDLFDIEISNGKDEDLITETGEDEIKSLIKDLESFIKIINFKVDIK